MGRRIIPLKGKRRRPGLPHPPAPPPTLHLKGDIARTVGVIRLLLETPSGFGIFSFDGTYLKKDNEDIWSYFVDKLWLHNVIWLKEFIRFENKSTAINIETGVIHVDLINMLKKWCDSEEKLAVGRAEYKMIIERNMEVTCLYDHNVEEVIWGLKNNLQFLVPQEKTKLTEKDCLPISKGFELFLIQYKIDMNPEMVNVHIAQQAGILHRTDLALKKHSAFFKLVGESLKSISDIDSKDWCSIKLATAAVMICHPDKIPKYSKMFSPDEYSKMKEDASRYEDVIVEIDTWLIYRDVVFLSEKKSRTMMKFHCLIEEAEKVDPILVGPQESQALEDSTGVIDVKSGEKFIMSPSPVRTEMKFVPAGNETKQVDSTSLIMLNQPSIAEGQHCLMSDDYISANDVDKGDERSTTKDIKEILGERSMTEDISARKLEKGFDVNHVEEQKQSGDTNANDVTAEESIGNPDGKIQTEDAGEETQTKVNSTDMNLAKLTYDGHTEMSASEASSMGNVTDNNQAEEAGVKGVRAVPRMENPGEKSTTKDISARKVDKENDVKHDEYQKEGGGTSANHVTAEESIDGKKQTEDVCLKEINGDDAEKLTKDSRRDECSTWH